LEYLPGGFRWLKRNSKEDVIVYFETFANLLEEKLLNNIHININSIVPVKKMVTAPEEIIFD
jgi:hypothetical protein